MTGPPGPDRLWHHGPSGLCAPSLRSPAPGFGLTGLRVHPLRITRANTCGAFCLQPSETEKEHRFATTIGM